MRLRLGTRGSPLARTQSEWVASELRRASPGLELELVVITTSGDRFSLAAERPQAAPAAREENGSAPPDAPNLKAMFVKEIQEALLAGEVDLAVHSSKDLPAELPAGTVVAAYPERVDPRDALLGRGGLGWRALPRGARIGTASLRRRIQLSLARPDLEFVELRGNVDTRLRRLEEGRADAVILACAGLIRLGKGALPREPLSEELLVPAPGQGALAVETRDDGGPARRLAAALDHAATRDEVELERALMRALGGGCSTPLGARAVAGPDGLSLRVFWSDAAGRRPVRLAERCGRSPAERARLVEDLAARLR